MAEHQPGLEVPFSDLPEVYIREQEPLYVCSSPSNQEEVIHPIVGSDAIKVGNAIKSSKQKICGLDRRYFWWSIAMFGALTIIIGAIVGGTVGGVLGRQRQTSINYNDNPSSAATGTSTTGTPTSSATTDTPYPFRTSIPALHLGA